MVTPGRVRYEKFHCSWKIWQGIKFDGLVVATKLKSASISYLQRYVRSLTEPLCQGLGQWQFWVQPPDLIPANISSYAVLWFSVHPGYYPSKDHNMTGSIFNIGATNSGPEISISWNVTPHMHDIQRAKSCLSLCQNTGSDVIIILFLLKSFCMLLCYDPSKRDS